VPDHVGIVRGVRVRLVAMMTVRDVARYLRVHEITIYRMVNSGRLPAVRVGRVWRFRRDDIDRWLTTNGSGTAPRQRSPQRSARAGGPRARRGGS
jgi:PTS system nitrogen regulatory IIA component